MRVDLTQIKELYEDGLQKYGTEPLAMGWKDAESHALRFKKLVEVIEDRNVPMTINELGCGYGAMFDFLVQDGFKIEKYIGYDISAKILEAAKSAVNDSKAVFISSSKITQMADYSFESGIFNVKFDINEDLWRAYIEETLRNMHEYSRKGFGFNLMTTYVDFKKPQLYYADPAYFFDFCKKNFSKKVSLLHDYDLFEWTIIVKR